MCCCCGKKGKHQNVTDYLAKLVVEFAQPTYQCHGGLHPTVICGSCRLTCSAFQDDGRDQTRRRFGKLLEYKRLVPPGPATRNSPSCQCSICKIARMTLTAHVYHNKEASNSLGRPKREVDVDGDTATPNTHSSKVICDYCHAEKRQGVEHVCNQTERRRNMVNKLKSVSSGTLETVLGEGLKEFQRRQEELTSPDSNQRKNEVTLKSRFGGASPLTVTVGKGRTTESRQLTVDDFLKMKKSMGLSIVQTKNLAGHIQVGTRNRKAVESGLAKALTERNNLLNDLFTSEQVLVENKDGKDEEKTLIYCNDVSELVLRLLEDQGLEQNKTDAKLGLAKVGAVSR